MSVRLNSQYAAQAARAREQQQNTPRPSRIRFNVQTAGIGESRLEGKNAINFGALMLEEPTFSWGVQALDKLATGELPLCTAVVLSYLRGKTGMYLGANVGFHIESAKMDVHLKFSLTFEGSTLRSTANSGANAMPAPRGQNSYNGPTAVNEGEL